MRLLKNIALALSLAISTVTSLQAASIVVGTHTLLPNTPGQVIDIVITGGESANGLNFYASVGDGGSDLGGVDTLPLFTTDIAGPATVFGPNNTGQIGGSYVPGSLGTVEGPGLFASANTTTSSGGVTLNGVLARLTFDTTGLTNNTPNPIFIPLRVSWPEGFGFDTNLLRNPDGAEILPQIEQGFIRIDPQGGGDIIDPPSYTLTPSSGSPLGPGDTVAVGNAPVASGSTGRDDGGVGNVVLTQGANGTFGLAPDVGGGGITAGSVRGSTVTFDGSGLLNNTAVAGQLDFDTLPGPNGAGNSGHASYPLRAVATGNSGSQASVVRSGDSYAPGGVPLFGSSNVQTGGVAELLAGTNAGADTTVAMQWRNRNANEGGSTGDTGTNPPLPAFATSLLTDVVNLTGTDGDTFVLQMSYDASLLNTTEADAVSKGLLYLASFDTASGMWVNAVALNHGANTGAGGQGAWSGQLELGAWGVDVANDRVWAVLDHNSEFGVVPEPSTILLAGLGALALLAVARRGRRS